jgi:gas vesicle protein
MRFLLGVTIGVALGAALGLLVAPQPGSETRKALRDRVRKGADDLDDELEASA